jgi:hypothetical protein
MVGRRWLVSKQSAQRSTVSFRVFSEGSTASSLHLSICCCFLLHDQHFRRAQLAPSDAALRVSHIARKLSQPPPRSRLLIRGSMKVGYFQPTHWHLSSPNAYYDMASNICRALPIAAGLRRRRSGASQARRGRRAATHGRPHSPASMDQLRVVRTYLGSSVTAGRPLPLAQPRPRRSAKAFISRPGTARGTTPGSSPGTLPRHRTAHRRRWRRDRWRPR